MKRTKLEVGQKWLHKNKLWTREIVSIVPGECWDVDFKDHIFWRDEIGEGHCSRTAFLSRVSELVQQTS